MAAASHWVDLVGEYRVDGDATTIGQLGQTEMACEEPRMQVEQAYLTALAQVTTASRVVDTLITGEAALDYGVLVDG
jgi:heat shock protein HslJ